jgi:hypothetical protein
LKGRILYQEDVCRQSQERNQKFSGVYNFPFMSGKAGASRDITTPSTEDDCGKMNLQITLSLVDASK